MNQHLNSCFDNFAPISLDDLNGKAEMLARIDNKYIMPGCILQEALASFEDQFDVLDIKGTRGFSYSTLYFDDEDRRGYYDHHQRKRKRIKARIRSYVDSDLHFLEVKLNDKRATTLKKRLRIAAPFTTLDIPCFDFIDACHRAVYEEPFRKELLGVLRIGYQRYTLVAKDGGERMTIDAKLGFAGADHTSTPPADIFIVETKSARGNGIADKVFRSLHMQPTKRVSKYCIGLAATGQVMRHNGFLPALRKLKLADQIATTLLSDVQMPANVIVLKPKRVLVSSPPSFNYHRPQPQFAEAAY
jgi:VTC domain